MPINIIGNGDNSTSINPLSSYSPSHLSQLGSSIVSYPPQEALSIKTAQVTTQHFSQLSVQEEKSIQNSFNHTQFHIRKATLEEIEMLRNATEFTVYKIVIHSDKKTLVSANQAEIEAHEELAYMYEDKLVGDEDFFTRHPDLVKQDENGEWQPVEGLIISTELFEQIKHKSSSIVFRESTKKEENAGKSFEELENEKTLRQLGTRQETLLEKENSRLVPSNPFPFYPFKFSFKNLLSQLLISEIFYQNLQEKRAKEQEQKKQDIEKKEIRRDILKQEIKHESIKKEAIKQEIKQKDN